MYLAHKKLPPPRTLQYGCAQGPTVVLMGWQFLMNEVALYHVAGAVRADLPRSNLEPSALPSHLLPAPPSALCFQHSACTKMPNSKTFLATCSFIFFSITL